jgi:hypothetical protein
LTLTLNPNSAANNSETLLFNSAGLTQESLPISWTTTVVPPTPSTGNLLDNPSFEEGWAVNPILGATVEYWTTTPGRITQETAIVAHGSNACRILGNNTAKLEQSTGNISGITPNDQYELSFQYYVVQSAGANNDIQLNCSWGGSNVDAAHDHELLVQNFTAAAIGEWKTKSFITTVPTNAAGFNFSAKIPTNATVIFDDFNFHKIEGTEPRLSVSPATLAQISAEINETATFPTLTVTTANVTDVINVTITGTNSQYFSKNVTQIPVGQTNTVITVSYLPTVTGSHTASLNFECPTITAINTSVSLRGACTNSELPPSITTDINSHIFPQIAAGEKDTVEVVVTTANLTDYPLARLIDEGEPNGAFLLVGNPVRNGTNTLKVVFQPNAAGTFTKRLEIYSTLDGISAFVDLQGTAAGEIVQPKEGDEYPLDASNPLAYMDEEFNSVNHNTVLNINQWKNIAEENYRAWWGYEFEDNNFAAKATAYNLTNTAGNPYEMWLFTPPLDFVNAATKVFTFRVMGDNMADDNLANLEVYYVLKNQQAGQSPIITQRIDGGSIPFGEDYDKVWIPIIIDFTGQNLEDVFFIGFRFYAEHGGNQSSVIYYVDDVTWGKVPSKIDDVRYNSDKVWADKNQLNISSQEDGVAVIFDVLGKKIDEWNFTSGENTFAHNLNSGIYIIQLQHANGTVSRKIVF